MATNSSDDGQSPTLTVTPVPSGYFEQQTLSDKHTLPVDMAHSEESGMDIGEPKNSTVPTDCTVQVTPVKTSVIQTSLGVSETDTISQPDLASPSKCTNAAMVETAPSSKTVNASSSPQKSAIMSNFVKIAPAQILPKHSVIQSSQVVASSFPIGMPLSGKGKHTMTYLGTLLKPDGAKGSENTQLVIPSNPLATKATLLSPSCHGLVSPPGSLVPTPVSVSVQPKQIAVNVDSAAIAHQNQKMANVFIPSPFKKQPPSNRYINVKISNGQIQGTSQASIKFLNEPKPLLSTSKMKLTRPQANIKLNTIKSSSRILPRMTAITAPSQVKPLLKEVSLAASCIDVDENQDLNRCLKEAVESMFSLSSPEVSAATTCIADEDDVTLIKVPAFSSTSPQQEQHSFIKYPDDVKIELISTGCGPTAEVRSSSDNISTTSPSVIRLNDNRGNSPESQSISQCNVTSSQKFAENKQTSNDITQCVTLSVTNDKPLMKMKPLIGAVTMVADTQQKAKSPISIPSEVRPVIKVPVMVAANVKRSNKTGVVLTSDSKFGNKTSILTPAAGTQPISRATVLTSSDIMYQPKILSSSDTKSSSKAATVVSYIKPFTIVSPDTKANLKSSLLTSADTHKKPMEITLPSNKDESNSMVATLVPVSVTSDTTATKLTLPAIKPDSVIASVVPHEDQLSTKLTAKPKATATTTPSDVKSDIIVTSMSPASNTTTMVTPSDSESRTFIATLVSPGGERQNITARILTPAEVKKNASLGLLHSPTNLKQNNIAPVKAASSEVITDNVVSTLISANLKQNNPAAKLLEVESCTISTTIKQTAVQPDISSTIPISPEVYSDADVATVEEDNIKPDVSTIPKPSEMCSDEAVVTMKHADIKPVITGIMPLLCEDNSDSQGELVEQADIKPDISAVNTSCEVYPDAAGASLVPLGAQPDIISTAIVTSGIKSEMELTDSQENSPSSITTNPDDEPEFEDTTVPTVAELSVATTVATQLDIEPSAVCSEQLPDDGKANDLTSVVESSDVTPDGADIRLLPADIESSVVPTTFVPTEVSLETSPALIVTPNAESCNTCTNSDLVNIKPNTFPESKIPSEVKTSSTTLSKVTKPDIKPKASPFRSKNMISILSPLENAKSSPSLKLMPLTDIKFKQVDTELSVVEITKSNSDLDELILSEVKTKCVSSESLPAEVKSHSALKTFKITDIKVVDNNNSRGNSILKTYLHPHTSSEERTAAEKAELSSVQHDSKYEGEADDPNSNKTPNHWEKTLSAFTENEVQFSLNEFGLIEIDTETNGKGIAKPKSTDNRKDDPEVSKMNTKDDNVRIKSKIGILCKKGSSLGKRSLTKVQESSSDKSDKSSEVEDRELVPKIKKLKKKIKSPITRTSETKEGIPSENAKPSDDIFHCEGCGCYGLEVEFHSSRFCSITCEEEWTRKVEADIKKEKDRIQVQIRRRKRKLMEKVHQEMEKMEARNLLDEAEKEIQVDVETAPKSEPDLPLPLSSEPSPESSLCKEEISNDGYQDLSKPRLPWQTGKHGFSWTRYLEYNKAKAAPVKLFKDPFPYSKNNFKVGMRLEGIDPKHPNYFCVLSVAEVCGFRIKLHFDGYSSVYDFWVNADSMDIFPPGWCEKNGYTLHPPPNYDEAVFNWSDYLKHTRSPPAPKGLFYNKSGDSICPNGFRIGMKLEAVDRQNTSLVCVASVASLMDSRILVHFDGWDDIYNYWADPSSTYIHPVGWCEEHNHKLTPPSDWKNSEFTWEKYLVETKSMAAPARAFKQRVHGSFKRGLKLECVDKRMPMFVRVATVDDVREHQIRVKFDGWSDIYSYWVDEDSRDIHPMGWCQTVGHVLELPLTSEDGSLECPTAGCLGQGHIMGSKNFANHTVLGCPYDPQMLIKKEELSDRLTSPPEDPLGQVCTKEKRPNEVKNPIGRPAKWRKLEGNEKVSTDQCTEEQDSVEVHKEKTRKKRKISRTFSHGKRINMNSVSEELRQGVINPGYKPSEPDATDLWLKHAYPLNVYISSVPTENDITNWTEDHVIKLISSISDSKATVKMFKEHNIDGEAFSMMTQNDLVSLMGIKIGPALKIYNCIMLLRQRVKENRASVF